MNKKGFTLVELLAVISILVILVLIALPNVLTMFNNAKKSTFETEVKEIAKTAEKQWLKDSLSGSGARVYSKCSDGSCTNPLDMIASDDLEYYIHMTSDGKIDQLYVKNNSFQYGTNDNFDINNINDIEDVSTVDNNRRIDISNNSVSIGPNNPVIQAQNIEVCYLGAGYLNSISLETKTCQNDQTVEDCIGSTYVYRYTKGFGECMKNVLPNATPIINQCLKSEGFGVRIDPTKDLVLPNDEVCYHTSYFNMSICLDGETEVYVYDKKKKKRLKKKLKDITYDDLILVWDFNKGEYVYANALWIQKPIMAHRSITLTFSDNTTLKVVGDHRIFNLEAGMFTLASDEKETPIGMTTIKEDGKEVTLISRVFKDEEVLAYNVITNNHINMFANGILTSQGSNNLYRIEDMKFVKEEREQFSDEDLKDIPLEYINGLMLKEWKVYDKGTKEATLDDLHDYINKLSNNRKSQ